MPDNTTVRGTAAVSARESRLNGSYTAAVSLSFMLIVLGMAILCVGQLANSFFNTLLLAEARETTFWTSSLAQSACVAVLVLALLFPAMLGMKGWYLSLEGEYHSPRAALSCFAGFRSYLSAAWFCIVRYAAMFCSLFFSLLPSIVTWGILRAVMRRAGGLEGTIYGAMMVLMVLLGLLGLCFGIYFAMGFFLMDYLYLLRVQRNALRAAALSFRMMRGLRVGLLKRAAILLPYLLAYVTVAGLPFAQPRVFAGFADFACSAIEADANDQLEPAD